MRGGLSGVQDVDYATISDEWSTSDESITKGFLPITHEADSWSTSLDDPRINSKGNRFLDASGCQTFVIAGNTNNIALENGNEEDYEFAVDYLRRMKTRKAIDLSKYESFVDELQGALQNRRGHSKSTIEFWVFVIRVISLFGAAAVIWAFVSKTKDPENWSTDDNSNDDLVLRRTVARGSIMSTVKTIVCTCLGAYMVHVGVAEQLVVTNLGFVLNPVLGYIDVGVATDEGLELFFTWHGVRHTFSSFISGNFIRYVVTLFLDLFISNPFQDILKRQARATGIMEAMSDSKHPNKWIRKWDGLLSKNFPVFLQAWVHFLTFGVYTSRTRFAWAIPKASLDRSRRMPTGSIMLATAIAGVLYTVFYCLMDMMSGRSYYDLNVKLCYVMAVFAFLYALNWKGVIEAPVEGEEYINLTEWAGDMKPFLGALVFIGFVMFGLVYPLWTKLGCCGKCKPKVRIRNQFAVKTGNVVVTRPRYQRQQVRESSLSSDVGSGTLLLHDKRQDESISDNGTEESDQIPTRKTFSLQRMQHSMEKAASILTKTI